MPLIRKYQEKDVETLIEVWFKASQLAHPFLEQEFLEQEKENIRKLYLPNAETWVAERESRVVGFVALLGNEVGALFVDPDCHGQKIGKALMDKAVAERGALVLDVFKENPIGRRFYERYGFRQDHEHRHEATGQPCLRLSYSPA